MLLGTTFPKSNSSTMIKSLVDRTPPLFHHSIPLPARLFHDLKTSSTSSGLESL